MAENWDTPRLEAEPPATEATLNEEAPLLGEARTQPPKLDSMLDAPHRRQKENNFDGEDSATGADFTRHENPDMSGGTGETEEKLMFHNETVPGASTNPKLDSESNQQDDETNATMTKKEIDNDNSDATSQMIMQRSRNKRGESVQISRPIKKTLKKRIAKVSKQLTQQGEYAKLVEDRLAKLEGRMKQMKRESPKFRVKNIDYTTSMTSDSEHSEHTTSITSNSDPTERYTEIVGINRVSFEQYKPKKPTKAKPTHFTMAYHEFRRTRLPGSPPRHIIDIVLPHFSTGEISQSNASNRALGGATATKTLHRDNAVEGLVLRDTQQVVPERIRINSSLLLDTIRLITNLEFSSTATHDSPKTQVILRPFKSLVTYEPEIRKYAQSMKEKVALLHAQDFASTDAVESTCESSVDLLTTEVNGSRPEAAFGLKIPRAEKPTMKSVDHSTIVVKEDIEESERRLKELETLIEVLDNDLKPVFDLRRRIEKGDISSIAYCDLWHLFRVGGEVCVNEGHSQVYRIVDIRGGRPALCTKRDAREERQAEREASIEQRREVNYLHPPKRTIYRSAERNDHRPAERNNHITLSISCFRYGFDGKHLGPVQRIFEIDAYDDLKPINSLVVYHVQFSGTNDGDLKREDFILRGKKFVELTKDDKSVVHRRYHGLTRSLDQVREEVDSEVIIDTSMALLKNSSLAIDFGIDKSLVTEKRETVEFLDPDGCKEVGCHQNTAIHMDYEVDDDRRDAALNTARTYRNLAESANSMRPEDLLICPCMVYGYVLRSRKWVSLDVEIVEDMAVQELGLDSLVLPKGHSETLLALVETHSKGSKPATGKKLVQRQIDLVRGKGKGLIILLHGEPGVGKTSTAECVAEYTKRPLFQVTCGDIGSTAEDVERTLEDHFQLAHKWGCVLLLDEADVFLMSRSKQDLKRNAIVSVFLRVLEYYSGILFLTTNRVGTFDPAFRSRIHMSFFYPKLNLKTTLEIWKQNLDRTSKIWSENIEIEPKEREKILTFAEDHYKDSEKSKTTWNGRQIRNAFQTAMALAEYEVHKARKRFKMAEDPVPRLEAWQFEKVAEASRHFDEYLKATVGLEEDRARENFERRDDLGVEDVDADAMGRKRRTART